MRTKPPTLATAEKPMDAEEWLWIIEKKLTFVRVHEADKVIFAVNQLDGPVGDWWDTYKEAEKKMLENQTGKSSLQPSMTTSCLPL